MPLLFLLSSRALALDADTFEVAGSAVDQRSSLQIVDPHVGWAGSRYVGAVLVYANDPLVRVEADGSEQALVSHAFGAHLVGGLGVGGVLRLDVALPVYPWVSAPGAQRYGPAAGDLRLTGTVPVWQGGQGAAIAVVPSLTLPTGMPAAYTGTGGTGASFLVAAGARPAGVLAVNGNLGVVTQPAGRLGETRIGSGVTVGAGSAWHASEVLRIGLEVDGVLTFGADWQANPWELHAFGVLGREEGLGGLIGVGTGLVAGLGAPDARVIAGVHWRARGEEPVRDEDGDGVDDGMDACRAEPEDADGYEDDDGCPDRDNDGDGRADADDRCPNTPEDRDGFEDDDGCPDPDNDEDDVLDAEDACPLVAGTPEAKGCPDGDGDGVLDPDDACPSQPGPKETRGCPDQDADLVPDAVDACPTEPRDPREDPARSDGCPKRVIVTLEKIEIKDKIFFETNKSTIKAASYELLGEIARAINANPDLAKIEVAGHTDNVGSDSANLRLSQGRAEAVVRWLTTQGDVDPGRLYAVGYGESVPLDTNATEAGRAANRRVEFVIKGMDPTKAPRPAEGSGGTGP